jgi:hypothetical protein
LAPPDDAIASQIVFSFVQKCPRRRAAIASQIGKVFADHDTARFVVKVISVRRVD